jgi:phosphatidylinositol alpha-1,6-mannosyltransferase
VPRKGQDTLIRVWPTVLARLSHQPVPAGRGPARARRGGDGADDGQSTRPVLVLVGDGPYARRLQALARRRRVSDSVIFAGSVPWEDLPAYYDAGTIFSMPCRTRRRGLDVEGLGIVYLEASATGLPVISGDSGGAPDAVLPGETGYVVGGRDESALADRLVQLLADRDGAATMGEKGLAWVDREWRWNIVAGRLQEILAG